MVAEKPESKTEETTSEVEVKKEAASPKTTKPKPLSKKKPAPKKEESPKKEETPKEDDTPSKEDGPKEDEDFKKPLPPTPKKAEENSEASASSDENAKPSEDATLILSAEEEAEISAQTNEDAAVKDSKDDKEASSKAAKKKKPTSKNVWVSNISRITKAADLKKLFSEKFKVDSAKIVTNGKSFFGYICLETPEMAEQSVKDLNGTTLEERKITVSLTRPDLRASSRSTAESRRREMRSRLSNGVKKSGEKDDEKKKEEKDDDKKEKKDKEKDKEGAEETDKDAKDQSSSEKKKEEETPEEKLKQLQRRDQRNQRQIQDLRADVKRLTIELQNNRRRLTEANRRLDMERDRKLEMRREVTALEAQLKSERRKFDQELEQMEKRRKVDELRYQEDRAILNKELDECRKLREYLQRKVDDLSGPRHGRSPPRRSGPSGRGMVERGSEKMQRPRMEGRGRSPPPPPKINARRSRERSPGGYKGKKPRIDEGPRGYNSHYQGGPQPSFQGNSKPLMGSYPPQGPGGPRPMYGTAYPEPARYGSYGGSFSMGNPAPLMSRPMGYPDPRSSSSQRKY